MKTRITPDGFLELPDYSFSTPSPKTPHRSRTLACFRLGDKCHAYVACNHGHSLFWAYAVGPGFSGDRSRASTTITTRNQAVAALWVNAVTDGKVRIIEA